MLITKTRYGHLGGEEELSLALKDGPFVSCVSVSGGEDESEANSLQTR